jgi:hypothetical protein
MAGVDLLLGTVEESPSEVLLLPEPVKVEVSSLILFFFALLKHQAAQIFS